MEREGNPMTSNNPEGTRQMTDNCDCMGVLWVCETHPDKPWNGKCCSSPGKPCSCNDGYPAPHMPRDVSVFIDKEKGWIN